MKVVLKVEYDEASGEMSMTDEDFDAPNYITITIGDLTFDVSLSELSSAITGFECNQKIWEENK